MAAEVQAGRYRVRGTLGAGGMARVALAEDPVLGRKVALKRLHASAARQSTARFRREARVGASLSHPNLVSIYDIVEDGDDLVLVMEYVEGETLRDALRRGRLTPDGVLNVMEPVAAGLDHAHRHGVVHRDVKPANILLGLDGAIKLADLGVAAAADRTRITTSGAVVGTIPYMAPEQLDGGEATPAVDVYALAAVAFEALSGRRARPEQNPLALAHAVATADPPDLRDAWADAPAQAAAVLAAGMAREPERRPRSPGELVGRLREGLDPRTTVAGRVQGRGRRRRPRAELPLAAAAAAAMPPAAVAVRAARPASPPATHDAPAPAPTPAATPRPAPVPVSSRRRRRRRPWLLAAAAMIALAALAGILIASTSGSSPTPRGVSRTASHRRGAHAAPRRHTAAAATTPSVSASTTATPPRTAVSASAGSPIQAVEAFYTLAAAHRYAQAWQLADPAFRAQLAGFAAFTRQQSRVQSIRFDSASVVAQTPTSAAVAVQTTPVVDGAAQQCHGTVALQRTSAGAAWSLHAISIQC